MAIIVRFSKSGMLYPSNIGRRVEAKDRLIKGGGKMGTLTQLSWIVLERMAGCVKHSI